MKKVSSMIQDGSDVRESTHLNNANTGSDRRAREASVTCLVALGRLRIFVAVLPNLPGSWFHSVIGSV